MSKDEVKKLLEELIKEDGYNNPLMSGREDIGEKYQEALQWAIKWLSDV